MGKLVCLKLGDGNFERGFPITLQIGKEDSRPSAEITGFLPPAPEIPPLYSRWQIAYRRLGLRSGLEPKAGVVTNVSKIEDCGKAARELCERLNAWLRSDPFCCIKEKLLEKLMPSDEIRMLLQTRDIQLQRLPWHLWDLLEHYPKAEIALSAPAYERIERPSPPRGNKVSILAILGNSDGIDTRADKALLKQLPGAEISFLVEPHRQALTALLWEEQGWDILFFAGHSSSLGTGETGHIYLNRTETLTIEQLKYALKKAVERGLKIAIFNSCDGLGLAQELASLQIPQIIAMREPVPDRVAQEFLKHFLQAFARGETFYLAVREAREKLQGLEGEFPCATWLPAICQNPAEAPPAWQEFHSKVYQNYTANRAGLPTPKISPVGHTLRTALLASLLVTPALMGARHLGMLQAWELQAFDGLVRLRPDEGPDPRILAVGITEEDFQLKEQQQRKGSLSDRALAILLQKLEQSQPRAIGLDIYRDFPADQKERELAARMRRNHGLIAICKVSEPEISEPGVSPPPEIPQNRQGFSDFAADPDGVIRRHLIAMKPRATSPCAAPYAFSAQLAFHYLEAKGIKAHYTQKGELQLGDVLFKRLRNRSSGYQLLDDWGYQILLNYRSYRSPPEAVETVTLTEAIAGKVNPDAFKNRIILIGVTAQSGGDNFTTPYSAGRWPYQEMPGVVLHAQMVSQILSAVLDGRPLLWVWPQWGEVLWVWGWSVLGSVLAWRIRNPRHLALAAAAALAVLYGLCHILMARGGWVPLVPPAMALALTGAIVAASPAHFKALQSV
ncbi:MAG: CHASE2 domain-containing protein [Oscillatoria princeps RMCB-10]|jgi:CHASE2 domain-containing sensor protein|nr:CHASE2 domain-containing protein [Oscillatoria princeps RMCB-10]